MLRFSIVLVPVLVSQTFGQDIIRVPADAQTIQIAIEKAQPFDTIIVAPGTYFEAISFRGKVIVVQSENPTDPTTVGNTIIDAGGLGSVVTFSGGEDQVNTILDGFTITGGIIGIQGNRSPAIIRHCVIRDNTAQGILSADGAIQDCQVLDNRGNGIEDSHGSIERCLIRANRVNGLMGCNGALIDSTVEGNWRSGVFGGDLDILRCFIIANGGEDGIGGDCSSRYFGDIDQSFIIGNARHGVANLCSSPEGGIVTNSVVAGNRDSGFFGSAKSVVSCTVTGNRGFGFEDHRSPISHTIIWDNQAGALLRSTTPAFSGTTNPFFVQPGFWDQLNNIWVDGDYHLSADSPYIDAGDPAYGDNPSNPIEDIDGNPRVVGARVDIGAFEFQAECAGADFDGDGTPDVCDRDIDGDGIPNVADRCDFTPLGVPVDSNGRPHADLNHDCEVNLRDYAVFQASFR